MTEPDKMTDPVERARYWKLRALAAEGQVKSAASKPAQEPVRLPDFIRREVERAIDDAINPNGMSVHDGKATIGADKLQYMLRVIDAAPPAVQGDLRRELQAAVVLFACHCRDATALNWLERAEAALAAPADDEAVRLLIEAQNALLDYVERLEKQGSMMNYGRKVIAEIDAYLAKVRKP
jgi:hypothetical protein